MAVADTAVIVGTMKAVAIGDNDSVGVMVSVVEMVAVVACDGVATVHTTDWLSKRMPSVL